MSPPRLDATRTHSAVVRSIARLQRGSDTRKDTSIIPPKLRDRLSTALPFLGIGYLALFWAIYSWLIVSHTGLFYWMGVDFGMFYGAGKTFLANGPHTVYDLNMLRGFLEPLHSYYSSTSAALKVQPVPYPPVFSLLVTPFSILPPVAAFVLWGLVNAGCGVYVGHDVAKRLSVSRWLLVSVAILSVPFCVGVLVGQPVGFILLIFYQAYRALERGEDLRSGLWMGLLLLKPQLVVALLFVLMLKRRWRVLAGAVVSRGVIVLSSFAILGVDGMIALYETIFGYGPGLQTTTSTEAVMISWHSIVALFGGGLSASEGLTVTVVLSLLTLATLPVIWRGPWRPDNDRFALRMLGTGIVTMLVGYDMHIHGAVLLIVPAMIVVVRNECPSIVCAAAYTSLFVLPLLVPASILVALAFVVLFVPVLLAITMNELGRQRGWAPSFLQGQPRTVTSEVDS